ncbi:MAG: hypothetical protein AB4368_21900 [Xenococcaceae cyanobacterium]
MVTREALQEIAANVQIFPDVEQKERFLFVVGALTARVISLKKAAEVMELEVEVLLQLLEIMDIDFSYLSSEDIALEKNWEEASQKKVL